MGHIHSLEGRGYGAFEIRSRSGMGGGGYHCDPFRVLPGESGKSVFQQVINFVCITKQSSDPNGSLLCLKALLTYSSLIAAGCHVAPVGNVITDNLRASCTVA